jgi:predicted nucleic acid-binding protein
MAASERVFIDSNFFIALFNPADSNHARANALAQQLESRRDQRIISNFIFLETVTVLAQRRGKAVAREVGNILQTDSLVTIVVVNEELNEATWRIFEKVEDKNISFVDCSTIALMRAENIQTLLTFDLTDFKKLRALYEFSLFE